MKYIYKAHTQSMRIGDIVEMQPELERTQELLNKGIIEAVVPAVVRETKPSAKSANRSKKNAIAD